MAPRAEPAPDVVIGGVPIAPLARREWTALFERDLQANRGRNRGARFMTSANGQVVSLAARDAGFRAALEQADAIDADGMSLVLASRLLCPYPLPERVATTDFFHDLAAVAADRNLVFYFLGATAAENAKAIEAVRRRYPGLTVKGRHGYFSENEEAEIAEEIRECGTDVLWVGLGVPREHLFVVRNLSRLSGVTWVKTCGGLFNFLSGTSPRAPTFLQDIGLEWAFRLMLEPRRLFWRYAVTNCHSLYLMATRRRALNWTR